MIKTNIKSVVVALIILYLSVSESNTLNAPPFFDIPNIDKVVHFGMYFTFMFVIILDHKLFIEKKRNIFLTGLVPFLYGIVMELVQKYFTESRSADFFDILFNTIGIIFAIALWKSFSALKSKRLN